MQKKALNLGVPYFTFSFATWLLKTVFSSSANDEIGGLADTLFIHPTPPYWYLYALFFIFLITPTFVNKKTAGAGLAIAMILKCFGIVLGGGVRYKQYRTFYQTRYGLLVACA
jgi:fucose 4-O-acetylase-like acetyltransferase